MFWSWEIKFIHNYPKCTKNKVNKSKSFLFTQSVGKTWNNIERIVFVKRVSDGPPFIFIAVRPDADHSDGTGAEQIKTRAISGQKTSKKSQNRAAHFLYINAGRKKRVNVVNDVCAISLPHLISRGEAELWWQLMTAYDMLWQLQFSPFPASLCPQTLTFVTTRPRACAGARGSTGACHLLRTRRGHSTFVMTVQFQYMEDMEHQF